MPFDADRLAGLVEEHKAIRRKIINLVSAVTEATEALKDAEYEEGQLSAEIRRAVYPDLDFDS